jgi:hypothetical protein
VQSFTTPISLLNLYSHRSDNARFTTLLDARDAVPRLQSATSTGRLRAGVGEGAGRAGCKRQLGTGGRVSAAGRQQAGDGFDADLHWRAELFARQVAEQTGAELAGDGIAVQVTIEVNAANEQPAFANLRLKNQPEATMGHPINWKTAHVNRSILHCPKPGFLLAWTMSNLRIG